MSSRKWMVAMSLSLALCAVGIQLRPDSAIGNEALGQSNIDQQDTANTEFVTAEELKAKLARSEAVTIIDVRSGYGLRDNDNKIKSAIYVKLRRLKSRLAFPPLKDVPRTQEVVTYCACPNDELSIRAAQVLLESGFTRVRVLKGGWTVWKKANGQVEPFARVGG